MLCRFINPEAAKQIFDTNNDELVVEMGDDDFLKEIQAHSTKDVNLKMVENKPEEQDISDLDTIERVED